MNEDNKDQSTIRTVFSGERWWYARRYLLNLGVVALILGFIFVITQAIAFISTKLTILIAIGVIIAVGAWGLTESDKLARRFKNPSVNKEENEK